MDIMECQMKNGRIINGRIKIICAFILCIVICACNKMKKELTELQNVYNLIIIDESGSMKRIEEEAVNGLNETFQTITAAQKEYIQQRHFVSLVTFNGKRIQTIYDRMPIEEINEKWDDYHPADMTPLFDAMGCSIDSLKMHVTKKDIVLVTIITDGMENASKICSGKQIKELVSGLKKQGWVFAYIGTNQDVDAVAEEIGIRSRMGYHYSSQGTREMWEKERKSRARFYDRISSGYYGRSAADNDSDYFDNE